MTGSEALNRVGVGDEARNVSVTIFLVERNVHLLVFAGLGVGLGVGVRRARVCGARAAYVKYQDGVSPLVFQFRVNANDARAGEDRGAKGVVRREFS